MFDESLEPFIDDVRGRFREPVRQPAGVETILKLSLGVGSVGDSFDDALAEVVIGLYQTEVLYTMARGRASRTLSSPP